MKIQRFVAAAALLFASTAFASHALPPQNLKQSLNGSPLQVGGMVPAGTAVGLTADNDPNTWGATYSLQIEVQPIGTAFTNTPNYYSSSIYISSGTGTFPVTNVTLPAGTYHWQAREYVGGATSSWVTFNGGSAAFTVGGATVSPATVSFNQVRVGTTSPPQTVTFTNSGTTSVTLNSTTVTGPFAISNSPTLPLTVAAGGTAQFQLTATPTAMGADSGTFTLNSTATNSPHTVSLAVTGGLPVIGVSPASVNFGDQGINATTKTQSVTVTNTGNAPLTISGGTASPPFSVSGLAGLVVAPNSQETFTVGFAPTALGPASGTLTINSDDPNTPFSLPLTGNGIEPHATLSQSAVSFTDTIVGATTTSASITLTNSGTGSLHLAAPTVPAGFTTNLTAQTVAQGASITFTITFAPTAPGPYAANFVVNSDDSNGPATITLSGTARAPGLASAPTSLSFGTVSLGAFQSSLLTLSNPGDATVTITALNLTGTYAADYSLQGAPSLPLTIAAGGSTQLTVKFAPTNVGTRPASLEVVSNRYPSSNLQVVLSGLGDGPLISVSPASLNFGPANLNSTTTRTFNVLNSGTQPLVVSGLTFSTGAATDFSSSQTTPFTVSAGGSTTVTVSFKPTQMGTRNSKVTVASSDALTPGVDVTLTGEGIAPNIFVSPLSLDFAQVRVGQSQQKQITIQNTGSGPLTLNGFMFTGNDAPRFTANGINIPYTLQPGAPAITLNVAYAPTSVGGSSANLVIASDDPDTGSVTLPLTGEGVAPGVAFSATSLNFGGQIVNRPSSPRTVDITNTGTAPLQVFALSITGAASTSYSVVQPSTPFTVQPGSKATVGIVLTAKTIGEANGRLILQSDAPSGAGAHVDLIGLGISDVFAVSPATVDFGTVKVNQVSDPVTVTLLNQSGETLPLAPAVLAGPNPTSFSVKLIGTSIEPGGTTTATITYKPTEAGAHAATLSLGSTDPQVPIAQLALTGVSVSRIIDASPSQFDFGQVPVGNTSSQQLFALTNKTSKPVTVTSVTSSSPEFVVDTTAIGTIEPGKLINIPVTFNPTEEHLAIGTLAVAIEGQQQGQVEVSIPVSGTGLPAPVKTGCSATGGMMGLWSLLAAAGTSLLRRRRRG